MARGSIYMHRHRVIHNDVKPLHLRICSQDDLEIADFRAREPFVGVNTRRDCHPRGLESALPQNYCKSWNIKQGALCDIMGPFKRNNSRDNAKHFGSCPVMKPTCGVREPILRFASESSPLVLLRTLSAAHTQVAVACHRTPWAKHKPQIVSKLMSE